MVSRKHRNFLAALILLSLVSSLAVAGEPATQGSSPAKVKAEYVAKINAQIEKGPDESLNAEPFYRKAMELYVEPPAQLDADAVVCWPTELTAMQRTALKKWVDSNSDALAQLQLGTQKPCYWFEYQEDIGNIWPSSSMREIRLPEALGFRAKLRAIEGKKEDAVSDLIACYRFGLDMKKRSFLKEQRGGLIVSIFALRAGFQILHGTEIEPAFLESLNRQLAERSKNQGWLINLAGHELMTLAVLENICTHWPKTKMEEQLVALVWSERLKELCHILLNEKQVYSSFHGHTPEELANLARRAFVCADSVVRKTPFQMHEEGIRWDKSLREAVDGNPYLLTIMPSVTGIAEMSFRGQAMRDALVTVLALLRYKNNEGNFPDDLQVLTAHGYLSQLPMDPYSDKPLVYRRIGSDFMLYSVGVDFQDNGGKHSHNWGFEPQGGDYVFWPVQKTEYTQEVLRENRGT